MADRCDGTLTHSQRGLVDTTSIDGRIEKILRPGQTIVYFCDPVGPGTVSGPYCVVLWIHYRVHLRQYVIGDFYTMGLSSVTDRDHYDLCVTKPGEAESCSTYPLGAPDALGYRKAGVKCIAERPGVFVARWLIDGVQLGPAFAFRARRSAAVPNGCRAEAL